MPTRATLVVDCRATLGEGLTWHAPTGAWLWTDIEGRRLWRQQPASGVVQSCTVRDRVGAFVVARSGRFLLGFAKGLEWADIDWDAGRVRYTPVVGVEANEPSTRVNDGRTDRSGHFVFGTMSEAEGYPPLGHLYQYSAAHGLRHLDVGPVGITNSVCFSPSGTTMYFCDSTQHRIMKCAYDADRAAVRDITPLIVLDRAEGMPDGSVVDADGAIWNAQWGGAAVRKYAPDGTRLETHPLPVDHVTCPAFGGTGLSELRATTARMGVAADRLAAQPETGGLYRLDGRGVSGIAEREFDDR